MNKVVQVIIRPSLKLAIVATMCLFCGQFAYAQVREAWIVRYGGEIEGITWGYVAAAALDHQGNLLTTGYLAYPYTGHDYTTIKYDKQTGQKLWLARYHLGMWDRAVAMTMDSNNDIIVTGSSGVSATTLDYATVKYDGQTEQQLWVSRYNGTGNTNDRANAITVDLEGNILVTGGSVGVGTNWDYTTIKYDGQFGQELWVARYNLPGNNVEEAYAVITDSEGQVFVTGNAGTIKYNGQTGQPIWVQAARHGRVITIDSQGNVLVTGGPGSCTTFKFQGQTGQLLWTTAVSNATGVGKALRLDRDGNIGVIGSWDLSDHSPVAKYSGQTGQVLWSVRLRGTCTALALDEAGDFYVTGYSYGYFPSPIGDFRTVKLDGRNGRLLWQRTYPNAQGQAIVVDNEGGVYVSGVEGPDVLQSYLTIKYEQAPSGDVNFDFCVDDVDLLRVLSGFGERGDLPEDVNRDGVVDDKDLLMVLFNFGRGCGEN